METKKELGVELSQKIREFFWDCETQLRRACREYNVPLSYYYILRINWREAGETQSDIADAAVMAASLASQVIQKMCKADLLIRKSDPDDARLKLVFITAKGIQLREELIGACEDVTVKIFKDITKKDISDVLAVFESTQKNL